MKSGEEIWQVLMDWRAFRRNKEELSLAENNAVFTQFLRDYGFSEKDITDTKGALAETYRQHLAQREAL